MTPHKTTLIKLLHSLFLLFQTVDSKIYTHIKQHTHNTSHIHMHTHGECLEGFLRAANEEEDQVEWDLSRIPVTTSLYGTLWMVELNMSLYVS